MPGTGRGRHWSRHWNTEENKEGQDPCPHAACIGVQKCTDRKQVNELSRSTSENETCQENKARVFASEKNRVGACKGKMGKELLDDVIFSLLGLK